MLTQSAVVAQLADRVDLTKKQVASVFDELVKLATEELARPRMSGKALDPGADRPTAVRASSALVVPGLGRLVLSDRAARAGRNLWTGAAIQIPAKRVVKFRIAKSLKDAVLGQGT